MKRSFPVLGGSLNTETEKHIIALPKAAQPATGRRQRCGAESKDSRRSDGDAASSDVIADRCSAADSLISRLNHADIHMALPQGYGRVDSIGIRTVAATSQGGWWFTDISIFTQRLVGEFAAARKCQRINR
jgi:hypothetical protein